MAKEELNAIKYENNYLKSVIFRLDFSEILKVNETPESFQDAIREDFPIFERRNVTNYTAVVRKGAGDSNLNEKVQIIWDFISEDKSLKVSVTSDHLSIETSKYIDYPIFQKIISGVVNKFYTEYGPVVPTRLGLRYINNINIKKGSPFEWSNLINQALTSTLDSFLDSYKEDLRRKMSQIFIKQDDINITFTYGMHNSEFPSKISRKEFILDYDCYTNEITEHDLVDSYVEPFHYKILELFEKSIEDGLRTIMKRVVK